MENNTTTKSAASAPSSHQREIRLLLNKQDNALIFLSEPFLKEKGPIEAISSAKNEENVSDSKFSKTEIRLLVNKHNNVHKALCSMKGMYILLFFGPIFNLIYNARLNYPVNTLMLLLLGIVLMYCSSLMYFGWCTRKFEHVLNCKLGA